MIYKISKWFRMVFPTKKVDSKLSVVSTKSNVVLSDSLSFKKIYNEKAKDVKSIEDFKEFSIFLIEKKLAKTEYGVHEDFMFEIRYFLHYLFLVSEDDYYLGDKVLTKTLTQLDNYIFSSYRRLPKLEKNIKKLVTLAYSNRFTQNPKENILSYFVFLEEAGIEIIDILEDFVRLLGAESPDEFIELLVNDKEKKLKKSYEKKVEKEFENTTMQTLHSVYSMNINSKWAKMKIKKDNLSSLENSK